jgi:two-component system NarL family sensor kinase
VTGTAPTDPTSAPLDAGGGAPTPAVDRPSAGREAPPSVARPVAYFALAGAVACVVLAVAGALIFRSIAREEAVADAQRINRLAAAVFAPHLTPALVRGDRGAVAALEPLASRGVLGHSAIVRIKVWSPDGRILWSDEPALIGSRFPLGEEERDVLERGGADAEVSDVSRPENRFERGRGQLVEVYSAARATDGRKLLFESYLPATAIRASERRILTAFAPTALGALVLLAVLQLPLAWSLARRLRDRHTEREQLLERAIEASDAERRRIAQDLHDGVVQDLAGLSYSLSAAAGAADDGDGGARRALLEGAAEARRGVRQLRSLLVGVYPPDLERVGLGAALEDLASNLPRRGIEPRVAVTGRPLVPEIEALFFRVAQEAVRNALEHARPTTITIEVATDAEGAHVLVSDDGRGFEATAAVEAGHFGLRLIHDLARAAGGTAELDSAPGRGTRVHVRVSAS